MGNLPLTAFDVVVVLVIALSVLISLMRGATRETLTTLSWVGAGVVAWYGFGYVRELARQTIETDWLADVAAFCVVFVAPLVGFKIVTAMLADRVPGGSFGLIDRTAGLAFGAARGAVIVSAAYLGLSMVIAPQEQPAWVKDAVVLPYVEDGAAMLRRLMPRDLALMSGAAADTARRLGDRATEQLATE